MPIPVATQPRAQQAETFILVIEARPHPLPAATRLRSLLKVLWRTHRLKCVRVEATVTGATEDV